MAPHASSQDRPFLVGLARAFGGAALFSLPILMTMEMWWLGFYAYRWRLALLLVAMVPLVVGLARYAGFRRGGSWAEAALEGATALGVGAVVSTAVLALFGVIGWGTPWHDVLGKVAVQTGPAAFGAVLARGQLGGGDDVSARSPDSYGYEMFTVVAGAFYLAGTVAATEEMVIIPYKMTAWHALALALFEVAAMHAFVYTMKFSGTPDAPPGTPGWSLFVRYTLPGYVVALGVSAYLLWTFGRFDAADPHWMALYTLALGLPATIGGAAGRLIL